uniref:Uncharacterized protein n=1 Tax=Arundo donax TaxID=35708 RepID=A0A0A9ER04_ARUDO
MRTAVCLVLLILVVLFNLTTVTHMGSPSKLFFSLPDSR